MQQTADGRLSVTKPGTRYTSKYIFYGTVYSYDVLWCRRKTKCSSVRILLEFSGPSIFSLRHSLLPRGRALLGSPCRVMPHGIPGQMVIQRAAPQKMNEERKPASQKRKPYPDSVGSGIIMTAQSAQWHRRRTDRLFSAQGPAGKRRGLPASSLPSRGGPRGKYQRNEGKGSLSPTRGVNATASHPKLR